MKFNSTLSLLLAAWLSVFACKSKKDDQSTETPQETPPSAPADPTPLTLSLNSGESFQIARSASSLTDFEILVEGSTSELSTLEFSVTSSNETLLPPSAITITVTETGIRLTATPAAGQVGQSTITVQVNENGEAASNTLTLNVKVTGHFGSSEDQDVTLSTAGFTSPPADYPRTMMYNDRIASISDKTWTLVNAFDEQNDIKAGDELFWHVTAAGTASSCADDVGRYGFTFVTSVDGTGSELNVTDALGLSPNNNPLVQGTDFCNIQFIRVPHFKTLTTSQRQFTIAFNQDTGVGGLLVFRVNGEFNITNEIWADSRGFGPGATTGYTQGTSYRGIGESLESQNTTGGSGCNDTEGAGGGANQGTGGNGSCSVGGGYAALECGGALCEANEKLFLGGAGGTAQSTAGGKGGGIVFITAKTLVSASAYITARGDEGGAGLGSLEGGAGAGGSIFLRLQDPGTSTLTIRAFGGDTDNDDGGGGGGGITRVEHCPDFAANTNIAQVVGGGDGFFDGSAGTSGTYTSQELCD